MENKIIHVGEIVGGRRSITDKTTTELSVKLLGSIIWYILISIIGVISRLVVAFNRLSWKQKLVLAAVLALILLPLIAPFAAATNVRNKSREKSSSGAITMEDDDHAPMSVQSAKVDIRSRIVAPEEDKQIIAGFFDQLSQTKMTRCKIDSLMSYNDFSIVTASPVNLGENHYGQAMFYVNNRTIEISNVLFRQRSQLNSIRHELHHGYISDQNYRIGRYKFDANHGNSIPFGGNYNPANPRQILDQFNDMLSAGIARIEKIKSQLDQGINTKQLQLFKKLASNYIPIVEEEVWPLNLITVEQQEIFNRTTPDAPLKIAIYGRDCYLHSFKQIANSQQAVLTYSTLPPEHFLKKNRAKAVLIDCLTTINQAKETYPRLHSKEEITVILPTEIDAELHALLEPYPELFKFLFPELLQHHYNSSTQEYRDCLDADTHDTDPSRTMSI